MVASETQLLGLGKSLSVVLPPLIVKYRIRVCVLPHGVEAEDNLRVKNC
jgi:hypothetical protein